MIHLGQYIPGESPVHRLDPRVRIISTVVMSLLILWGEIPSLVLCTVLVLSTVRASNLRFRHLATSLKPIRIFLLIFFCIHLFLGNGKSIAFFSLGPVVLTYEGFYTGMIVVWQFSLLIWGSSILTATTSPSGIVSGLERLMKPLQIFAVPTHDLALMVSIALRFVPTFLVELERIKEAQIARGADFRSRGLIKRTRTSVGLLVPLFLSFVRRADDLVIAMEARGFSSGPRTSLVEMQMKRVDYEVITVMALLSAFHVLHTFFPHISQW